MLCLMMQMLPLFAVTDQTDVLFLLHFVVTYCTMEEDIEQYDGESTGGFECMSLFLFSSFFKY